jgi:hypothetical protein
VAKALLAVFALVQIPATGKISVDVVWLGLGRCGTASADSCTRVRPYCSFLIVRYDISCGGQVFGFIGSGEYASGRRQRRPGLGVDSAETNFAASSLRIDA